MHLSRVAICLHLENAGFGIQGFQRASSHPRSGASAVLLISKEWSGSRRLAWCPGRLQRGQTASMRIDNRLRRMDAL